MSTRQLISSGSRFEAEIGYSRAVVSGDWVFVSGTTGFDRAEEPVDYHADGEFLGQTDTFEVRLDPLAISILA